MKSLVPSLQSDEINRQR